MIVVGQDVINNTQRPEYAEGTFSYHDAAWVKGGGGDGGKYKCRMREKGILSLSGSF